MMIDEWNTKANKGRGIGMRDEKKQEKEKNRISSKIASVAWRRIHTIHFRYVYWSTYLWSINSVGIHSSIQRLYVQYFLLFTPAAAPIFDSMHEGTMIFLSYNNQSMSIAVLLFFDKFDWIWNARNFFHC